VETSVLIPTVLGSQCMKRAIAYMLEANF